MWRTNWRRFISSYSNAYSDKFALGVAGSITRTQFAGGFDNKSNGFLQVAADFGQRPALRVHTRNFFNRGDVPPSPLLNNRRELPFHRFSRKIKCITISLLEFAGAPLNLSRSFEDGHRKMPRAIIQEWVRAKRVPNDIAS